ncbi:hypothetical protein ACC870_37480, partial [Rhizobium ruizarguesonis]
MRIAVTGKQGQIVQSLLRRCAEMDVEISAVGRPEMDLADTASSLGNRPGACRVDGKSKLGFA